MWLVKVPVRRGDDVVVATFNDRLEAEETAHGYNFAYDTDAYYIEEAPGEYYD